MNLLVVDNYALCGISPEDEGSGNIFQASTCLNNNRRTLLKELFEGRLTRSQDDTNWFMRILPEIARYFNVPKKDLLNQWVKEYGVCEVFGT